MASAVGWSARRSGGLVGVPIIALVAVLACPSFAAITGGGTLLVVGDSLSAAYGIPEARSWVALLARRLPDRRVVNASISGETSAGARVRLPELLERTDPDIVVIELGANDGLRGQPIDRLHDNLAAMIRLARAHGAAVLLVGMELPPNYGRRYTRDFRAVYRELAREYGVPLVPFLLTGVATEPGLMQADGLHPTAAAQPRILETVWRGLAGLLAGRGQAR